ncbi:DEAD/DEAH box helicase [Bacteroidia bacterium]|nr:DEAD/DEAH box helicase [Bacteroidia bacterium]
MNGIKTQAEILNKLGIAQCNEMQLQTQSAFAKQNDIVLLSPTGSGKTLAFLLPLVQSLNPEIKEIQAIIIAPTRELAIQIEQVARSMGSGHKTNVVYGGRSSSQDRRDIETRPAILVGTPGRIADHLHRGAFETRHIKTLILDEFDKSLEIGFEGEMIAIIDHLSAVEKKILTSATQAVDIPTYTQLNHPINVNFLATQESKLTESLTVAPYGEKLPHLIQTLQHIGNVPGIIFCNFKDTIGAVSDFLSQHSVSHGVFYGGLEQRDRESALIKFRNGTHQVLLATDLAARGIDVPELGFILHYELPSRKEEYIHRNGRTARMNAEGTAYILAQKGQEVPEYMPDIPETKLASNKALQPSEWATLFISGGKKDKISKGDVAGLMMKQAGLKPYEVGFIESKLECTFVAIKKERTKDVIAKTNNTRLKRKKVRVTPY